MYKELNTAHILNFPEEHLKDFEFLKETSLLGPPLIDRYTHYLLLHAFQQMDVFKNENENYTLFELQNKVMLVPQYQRLFVALLEILERAGFILYAEGRYKTCSKVVDKTILNETQQWKESSGASLTENASIKLFMQAYLKLLNVSIEALPHLLNGEKKYMDVLVPKGDLTLLAGIYNGNLQQLYNRLVATITQQLVQTKIESASVVNILEIGAGTGASTIFILEKLKSFSQSVQYYFTDIAGGFTRMAMRKFSEPFPFVKYKTFDATKDPQTQGFEENSMDLIICNNVLHATASVAHTLVNINKLLKNGGQLIINELTTRTDFNTCVFGLTNDWWNYTDESIRIPHSPMLTEQSWKATLNEVGLKTAEVEIEPPLPLQNPYQHIFVSTKP